MSPRIVAAKLGAMVVRRLPEVGKRLQSKDGFRLTRRPQKSRRFSDRPTM
ncbi:hypothetical protein ACFP1C_06985 [Levilactobacillus fujinensis]|uniref:Uncharacterized protein n=1 Tax=Levilactobacillus fujinensis TaxID=2486024 RepID=A0ABW1THK0_9LACO